MLERMRDGRHGIRQALPAAGAILAIAVGAFAGPAPMAGKTARPAPAAANELTREFAAGGTIRMHLGAGDYVVRGSHASRIRVRWSLDSEEDARRVRVKIETNGPEAVMHVSGPHNHFRVEIEVPSVSNLYVRQSVGDMRVEGIEGNKNIQLHVGDLNIDVGRPETYSYVDASVQIGDIDAEPFHASKGGFWRSFHWTGNGKYRLHAHIGTGDLELYAGAAP